MRLGTTAEVGVHVDAAPDVLYDLVTDVSRMGEWSPECVGARWRQGSTSAAAGARFRGSNRSRFVRWVNTCKVVEAERGRCFSFVAPDALGRPMTKWTYRFSPAGSGTELTESFELLRDFPGYVKFFDRVMLGIADRKANLEANITTSLERIKALAERG